MTVCSEKMISPESGEKCTQIKHCSPAKTVLKYVGVHLCESKKMGMDFFSGGSLMDYRLMFWPEAFHFNRFRRLSEKLGSM